MKLFKSTESRVEIIEKAELFIGLSFIFGMVASPVLFLALSKLTNL